MITRRTDLALEAKEIYESESGSFLEGVKIEKKELENCIVTIVDVLDDEGAKIMNKGIGKYITLESDLMKYSDDDSRNEMISYLKEELSILFGDDKTKNHSG